MNIFHYAVEGGDLETTLPFYTDILGCELGPLEPGLWQDIDFFGHELTLHQSAPTTNKVAWRSLHDVDDDIVVVPHFGIHLRLPVWDEIRKRIEKDHGFLKAPFTRFDGTDREQRSFFVEDPHLNVLELKTITGDYYRL